MKRALEWPFTPAGGRFFTVVGWIVIVGTVLYFGSAVLASTTHVPHE